MRTCSLCLLGFGSVGQSLLRLLVAKTPELRDRYGIDWRISGLASRRLGWIADPAGLDPEALLAGRLPSPVAGPGDVRQWLEAARADVLFENTSLDTAAGQPAIDHLRAALEHGAHAITANKGPVVHAYRELRDLALARGRGFRIEATVMAGAPIFSLFRETLPAATLLRVRGLLNSTSNLILGELEAGRSYEQAVAQAQALGITETDPSHDVDGWDSAVKLAALVSVLMDDPLPLAQVARRGIRDLAPAEVRAARAAGRPYKLVCEAERRDGRVAATVEPRQVPLDDPLALVNGTASQVRFELDTIAALTVTEYDTSVGSTAYGLLADFISLVRA